MARELKTFSNASMTAGKIQLRMKGGVTTYRVTGWVTRAGDNIQLLAEDQRRQRPVMVVPVGEIESLTVDLLT